MWFLCLLFHNMCLKSSISWLVWLVFHVCFHPQRQVLMGDSSGGEGDFTDSSNKQSAFSGEFCRPYSAISLCQCSKWQRESLRFFLCVFFCMHCLHWVQVQRPFFRHAIWSVVPDLHRRCVRICGDQYNYTVVLAFTYVSFQILAPLLG